MFYTLDSWNRILHLGSQTCGIRVARPSRNKRKRNDPEGHASTVQRARVRRRISRRRGRGRRKRKRGVRYTWPGTARPISPVRPNSARDQKPWPLSLFLSLSLSLSPRFVHPSVAAVYGRHYLDRALARIKRFVRVHGPLYRSCVASR